MNGQRTKLLKKKFIELYGAIEKENVKLFKTFKKRFSRNIKINSITKELFETN